ARLAWRWQRCCCWLRWASRRVLRYMRALRRWRAGRLMNRTAIFVLAALCGAGSSYAQSTHWVETWTAAQQTPRVIAPPNGATAEPASFSNQTVRMILHTTIGGQRLRLELANTHGRTPP